MKIRMYQKFNTFVQVVKDMLRRGEMDLRK